MSRKFLTHIDLAKNELQNAVVQNLAAAPSSPVKGQLYFDTSTNTLYWWNGTAWIAASPGTGFPGYGAVTQEQTFGATKNDGVAATVPRSDHTHGNPVHDNAAHAAVNLSALAAPTTNVSMNGFKLTSVGTPTVGTDAVTKDYADNLSAGLSWKEAVRIATTANITQSGLTAIDGVTPAANDRILCKDQSTGAQNGIWLAASGSWTRALDADAAGELDGACVFVMEGTANADKAYVCTTNPPITPGTTATVWVQFGAGTSYTAGNGLTLTGSTFDVGAGNGIVVAADTVLVDGTLVGFLASANTWTGSQTFSGATNAFTNNLTLTAATPSAISHATRKDYVDGQVTTLKATTVSAGAGLVGGGDLTANRTFDVGAGTGVTVAADTVALDTTYTDGRYALAASAAKRYAVDVGGSTSQVITHSLNTLDVIVQVYRKASPFDQVECDVEHTSTTTATLRFTVAPAAAEYRAVVMA